MIDHSLELAGKLASFFYEEDNSKSIAFNPVKDLLAIYSLDFFLNVFATYFPFLAFIYLLFVQQDLMC